MLLDKLAIHLSKYFKNRNVMKISGIWEELFVSIPINFSASASQTNLLWYRVWDGRQDSGTGAWSWGGKSRGVDGNLQEQLPKDSDFHRRNPDTMQVRSLTIFSVGCLARHNIITYTKMTRLSRSKGYVETMGGRRRYLPNIKAEGDEYQWVRGAAERQAVNTTVQGSAADLVKKAIVNIDKELRRTFQG